MTTRGQEVVPGAAFRKFWTGQAVSFVGTQVTAVALPLVAVLYLDATAAQFGLIVAAEMAPHLLAPVILGNFVDQHDQRRLLLIADYGRLAAFLCIPSAYYAGALTFPLLVGMTFLIGLLTVLNDIAFFSFVPRLVPAGGLTRANGRLEASRSTAMVVGPGLGGILSHALGAVHVLLFDAMSYAFSIWQLHGLRKFPVINAEAGREAMREPWYAGFTEVVRRPALRLLAGGSGAFNFFSAGARALTVLFVIGDIGMSASVYGIAIALGGLGGVAGGVATHQLVKAFGTRLLFSASLLACGGCEAALVLMREPDLFAFVVLAASHGLAMFGVTVYIVLNASIRQQTVPPHLHGRVFGTMRMIARGLMPLGALACGLAGQWLGLREAIIVVATGEILVAVVFAIFSRLIPPMDR